MISMNKVAKRTAIFLASSVLLQGMIGFSLSSPAAQPKEMNFHHRDALENPVSFWGSLLGWGPWATNKNLTQGSSLALQPGQKIVTWPDGTQVVVDSGGMIAATNAGIQPVSQNVNASPATGPVNLSQQATEAAADQSQMNQVNQNACNKVMRGSQKVVRASDLSPGHILIDEQGRRIEMADNGVVYAGSKTAISMVPDWAPGTTLVSEKDMEPGVFQKVFPNTMAAGQPTILPPTATASILPAGSTVASAFTTTPVTVGTCPMGLTDQDRQKDQQTVSNFFRDHLQTATLTQSQYMTLSPAQQRLVLQGEPLVIPVSELSMPFVIPQNVQSQIVMGGTITPDVISQYGVALPDSLSKKLSTLPTGYQRVMIGGNVVTLSPSNQIVDTYSVMGS